MKFFAQFECAPLSSIIWRVFSATGDQFGNAENGISRRVNPRISLTGASHRRRAGTHRHQAILSTATFFRLGCPMVGECVLVIGPLRGSQRPDNATRSGSNTRLLYSCSCYYLANPYARIIAIRLRAAPLVSSPPTIDGRMLADLSRLVQSVGEPGILAV